MKHLLSAACLLFLLTPPASAQPPLSAQEPDTSREFDAAQEIARLEKLVVHRSGTRELLDWLQRISEARMLHLLGNGNLPFSTWPISGWRWESPKGSYGRVLLAIDGPYMVAIREQNKSVSMSVRDVSNLRAAQTNVGYRLPGASRSLGRVEHVDAMSLSSFSRTHPELFQVYYYFAGPTGEVVSSSALPPSPMTVNLLE